MPTAIDWSQHLHTRTPVRVSFWPRASYQGREALAGMLSQTGAQLSVVPLWQMDEDDPYPGEWALGAPDYGELLGRSWIASGDVVPLDPQP